MTKNEAELLLHLEDRTVNNHGRVNPGLLNDSDWAILARWTVEGFVQSGRIRSEHVNREGATWVQLSDAAFTEAHRLRRERAARLWKNRTYQTTEEARNDDV